MISTQTTAVPKLFIGMDVHKKSWTVHFKTDLFDYKTVTMPADPVCLQQYVQKKFPEHEVSCCYEAGCCGYWIARGFKQLNWKVIVVNPADVPRTNKQDWQKTDKIDCRNLSEQLRKGGLHGIHIPDEEQEQLRSLFAAAITLLANCALSKITSKANCCIMASNYPSNLIMPVGAGR